MKPVYSIGLLFDDLVRYSSLVLESRFEYLFLLPQSIHWEYFGISLAGVRLQIRVYANLTGGLRLTHSQNGSVPTSLMLSYIESAFISANAFVTLFLILESFDLR